MRTYIERKFRVDILLALLLQAVCLLIVFALGLILDNTSALSNLYVTDGVNLLTQSVDDVAKSSIERIAQDALASAGFLIFNAAIQSISPLLFFCVNSVLLLVAIGIYCRWNSAKSLLLFLMLPYFWLSAALPSKDIVNLALFALLAYRLVASTSLIGYAEIVFWSAVIFSVRDGFGLVLFGASSLIYFGRKFEFSPRIPVIVGLVAASGLEFIKDEVLSYLAIGDRSWVGEASEFSENIAAGMGGLLVRLFGNITNLAFRPVFLDVDGGVSALGFASFVSGLSLVVTFAIFSYRLLASDSVRDQYIAAYGLICMFALSLAPLVQGRYFLPLVGLVFLMSNVSAKSVAKYCLATVFLSLLMSVVYRQMPGYPPPYDSAAFSLTRVIDWP